MQICSYIEMQNKKKVEKLKSREEKRKNQKMQKSGNIELSICQQQNNLKEEMQKRQSGQSGKSKQIRAF